MEITLSSNNGLAREFKIAINASEIEERVDAKLNEISKQVKMPGFRPGKVPISVVKARYGEQSKGEVIQTMLDEAAREAIESNDLNLASQPSLDITAYEGGSDLEAKLKCEILPEIKLPDISALSIERPTLPLDEAEVSNTIQRLASENSPTVESKKGYKAALGDVVVIDFEGSIDGVPFDGGAAQDHSLELGSNSFIPGFEDGLVGVRMGDKINIDVPFPEAYQAAHLAGKLSVFAVTIKEVRTKGDPVLDDALAEKLGFEKLSALEEAVRNQLSSQHQPALRQMLKKNILDQLNEQADFNVPPTLLSSEYDVVVRSIKSEQGIEDNHDQAHDHDHKHAADDGLDEASKEEAKVIATRRVRLGLMLTEIGRANDIKVSEEDTKRAIFEQARNYPGQEQQIVEHYQKNPEATQQLAGPLFEDKVIDYIVELAKVTDFETNLDVLYEPEVVGNSNGSKKSVKKATKAKAKKAVSKSDTAIAKKKPSEKKSAKKAVSKSDTAIAKKKPSAKKSAKKAVSKSDTALAKKKPTAKKSAKKVAVKKS